MLLTSVKFEHRLFHHSQLYTVVARLLIRTIFQEHVCCSQLDSRTLCLFRPQLMCCASSSLPPIVSARRPRHGQWRQRRQGQRCHPQAKAWSNLKLAGDGQETPIAGAEVGRKATYQVCCVCVCVVCVWFSRFLTRELVRNCGIFCNRKFRAEQRCMS